MSSGILSSSAGSVAGEPPLLAMRASAGRPEKVVVAAGRTVLFLAPVPDFKGGAERSLMDLLANRSVRPLLVVPAEGPLSRRATELGIPWEVLGFGRIGDIRRPFRLRDGIATSADLIAVARRLVAITRTHDVDIVHSNGLKAHAIALAARRLGGPPTVVHIRDIANTRVERLVWSAFQRLSDRTVLVSRACWPTPALPRNVHVIYNGFAVDGMAAGDGISARSGDGPLVLGFVGRIHPFKGLHVMLPGIGLARDRGVDVRLVVRGAFAPETPAYEQEIRDQIVALGLSGAVGLEGYVSDPDRVYEGLDVVCMPSVVPEPFGRAAMEAMGRGLAVIAWPTGGLPELVRDGETGFLVDSPEDFAGLVVRLADDPALRADIGARARAFCIANLSVERLHTELHQVYALAAGAAAKGP